MNIILVITSSSGKNLIFVTKTLKIYSFKEAIGLAERGILNGVYLVQGRSGPYLRAKPNRQKEDNLDHLSLSLSRLFASRGDLHSSISIGAYRRYWRLYQKTLKKNVALIFIDGHPTITQVDVKLRLLPNRSIIFKAGKKFHLDPYLLSAIIIDEVARAAPIEPIIDLIGASVMNMNISAGIAQVKIETARDLIKRGYYNPDPSKLSEKTIELIQRQEIYRYVKKSKHSIYFAAARMRALIDEWKSYVDLNQRPDIIATLYSRPYKKPNRNPEPNARGLQISQEFYLLAKKWFQ